MIKLEELGTLCTAACLTVLLCDQTKITSKLNTDVLVRDFGVELLYYLNRKIVAGKQITNPDS